jgi:hypothetical protein
LAFPLARFRLTREDLLALRKSAVLRLWLRKSWSAWVGGLLYSIFAGALFPLLARPVLTWIFPPTQSTAHLLGTAIHLGPKLENPNLAPALEWSTRVVWLLGFSLFMAVLELKLRPAISAARLRSEELEAEAAAAMASSPSRSVLLLRDAAAFAVGATREKELERKIGELDGKLAGAGATILPSGQSSRRIGAAGRYRLEKEIGRGGMGVVWRAQDSILDRPVAMKELPHTADPDLRERFRQEARALARLSHPNVVQVYDLVEEGSSLYLAMELVEGGDLQALLEKRIAVGRAIDLGRQIAAGLAYAHRKGVVHRDVKPLNVLVTAESVAKVTDFGLAKLSESTMHTMEGAVLGSPRYMSPEQAAGKPADARSDAYSCGATLFHLVTGRPPFEGDTQRVLAQHITQPAPRASTLEPAVPPALDDLLLALLSKDPADRPPLDSVEQTLRSLAA